MASRLSDLIQDAIERAASGPDSGRTVVLPSPRDSEPAGHHMVASGYADAIVAKLMTREAQDPIGLAIPVDRCRTPGIRSLPTGSSTGRLGEVMVSMDAAEGVRRNPLSEARIRTIAVAPDAGIDLVDLTGPTPSTVDRQIPDDGCEVPVQSQIRAHSERPGFRLVEVDALAQLMARSGEGGPLD